MHKIKCASMAVSLIVLSGCSSERQEPGVVAKEWSINTRQLGIYPLFPPKERVYPGDIYIFPTAPTHAVNKIPSEFYTIRPIRYSSQNVSVLLQKEQETKTLPETLPFNDATGLRTPGPFTSYPSSAARQNGLIVFPGFTFASVSDIQLGIGFANSAAAAKAGGASKSKYNLSFSVPYAETISLDFKSALAEFRKFRAAMQDSDTDALRFIGDQMQYRINDLQSQTKNELNISPGIVFITDVYYARAIDVTVASIDGFGASGTVTLAKLADLAKKKSDLIARLTKLPGNEKISDEKKPVSGDTGSGSDVVQPETGGTDSNSQKVSSLKEQIASLETEMQALSSSLMPDGLGITGSVTRASGSGFTMQQVFKYPVAIGYNGIALSVTDFTKNPDLDYSKIGLTDSGRQPLILPSSNLPYKEEIKP